MKRLIILFVVLCSVVSSHSQENNSLFNTKKEYIDAVPRVKELIDWYFTAPMTKDDHNRQQVQSWLFRWIVGAPNVMIDVTDIVAELQDSDLMMAYMLGATRWAVDNDYPTDKFKATEAGLESVISFYQQNKKFFKKNKAVEHFIKLKTENKFEDYIKESLPK